jgi:integrase
MIIADMLRRYISDIIPKKKNGKVETHYINKILGSWIAQQDLRTLKTSTIAAYRDELLETRGPRCARYHLQLLSHATTMALSEWDLDRPSNPFKLVKKPPQGAFRTRRLEGDEAVRLIQATDHCGCPYLQPIVGLAIATAMRRTEVLTLRWSQVKWQELYIEVDGKTGHRKVPISRGALTILKDLYKLTGAHSCGRVFPISFIRYRRSWDKARKMAGLVDFHFHDLRHESISRYMERGDLTLQEVATISGHKTLNMLWRYTHLKTSALANKL